MGQGDTSPSYMTPDWSISQVNPHFTIIRNKVTNQPLRLYQSIIIDQLQFQQKERVWGWRKLAGPNIIRVLQTSKEQPIFQSFCSKHLTAKIITEHFEKEISSEPKMALPEAVHFLKGIVKGCLQIKKTHGKTFQINAQMIGYSYQRQPKVWMNSNLAKNQPQVCCDKAGGERRMIRSILETVNENTEGGLPRYLQQLPMQKVQVRLEDVINATQMNEGQKKSHISVLNTAVNKELVLNLYRGRGSTN